MLANLAVLRTILKLKLLIPKALHSSVLQQGAQRWEEAGQRLIPRRMVNFAETVCKGCQDVAALCNVRLGIVEPPCASSTPLLEIWPVARRHALSNGWDRSAPCLGLFLYGRLPKETLYL